MNLELFLNFKQKETEYIRGYNQKANKEQEKRL